MASLNSRMPEPTDRPTWGSFFGPSTISAMIRTTISSIGPMLGINSGHLPGDSQFGATPDDIGPFGYAGRGERGHACLLTQHVGLHRHDRPVAPHHDRLGAQRVGVGERDRAPELRR